MADAAPLAQARSTQSGTGSGLRAPLSRAAGTFRHRNIAAIARRGAPALIRLRHCAERGQRPLDLLVPAVFGISAAWLDPRHHQPFARSRHCDVEQPPMLLQIALLLVGDDHVEGRHQLCLLRPDNRDFLAPDQEGRAEDCARRGSPDRRSHRQGSRRALPGPWRREPSSPARHSRARKDRAGSPHRRARTRHGTSPATALPCARTRARRSSARQSGREPPGPRRA